jgi:cyclopropane-fatty-acyl-phospholipid synthase
MNAHSPRRGADLVNAGRRIGAGPQWLARLWTGGVDRLLDRIDAGLERGSILATLPGGHTRLLGGREPGFGCEVEVRSWRALLRLATSGSVGWYQAWEAGEWDSPDPVPLFALFMDNALALGDAARATGPWRWLARALHRVRRNSRSGSQKNIHAHYDLGNDFYELWLGETMFYSSAIFDRPERGEPSAALQFFETLDLAQSAKLTAIEKRLDLSVGDAVLEIGCGWGTAASFIAGRYTATIDAISLSDEQLAYARERWQVGEGAVRYLKRDYRDVHGTYDAIYSIEMVEAVGREHWPDFMDCIARCLRPGGLAAIQYISIRDELFDAYAASADFIQTYIFPGGMLIRESEFRALAEERGLIWRDRTAFGQDYARTLRIWRENFDDAVEQGKLPPGFDARFVRLWRYYLMYCEGGFLGGGIDVAQVTLEKPA